MRGFKQCVAQMGFRSINDWANSVLSAELEKLASSRFAGDTLPADSKMRSLRSPRHETERLATISGPCHGHQLRVSIVDPEGHDEFGSAVAIRRWRDTGSGWFPQYAALIFQSELLSVGKALRVAFDKFQTAVNSK
jgi:hypothetical protein